MAATLVNFARSRSARLVTAHLCKQAKHVKFNQTRDHLFSRSFGSSSVLFDATDIKMPSLSPTMTQGNIVKWYKKEGDPISAGDVLCDIETDKAVVSFDIEEDGILAKIMKPENSRDVQVGALIAVMVEEGDDWQNVQIKEVTDAPVAPPVGSEETPAAAQMLSQSASSHDSQHGIGPAVRTLLELYHLQAEKITATGPHNRLLKGDVLKHIKQKNLQPVPQVADPVITPPSAAQAPPTPTVIDTPPKPLPSPVMSDRQTPPSSGAAYEDYDLTSMRQVIAKRLTESKTTIPHAYASIDCDVAEIAKLRKKFAEEGVKVSVNDFIIKASAVALQTVPEVNALWNGEAPRLLSDIDISVAVATPNGLITPIVKDAISLGLEEISTTVKDLATRARAGKLALHEFQGGSFTISNLGMFGITEFSAVINPPQACILAVGGSRLVLGEGGEPQSVFTVTLSSDARMVDDATAARFLEAFRNVIENPMMALSQTNTILQRLKAGLA